MSLGTEVVNCLVIELAWLVAGEAVLELLLGNFLLAEGRNIAARM